MNCGTARVDGHDMNAVDSVLNLIDGLEVAQYPRHKLQVAHRLFLVGITIRLILPISGEIEQSGGKSRLVDTFNHELRLLDCKTDISVLGSEHHAFLLPIGRE